MTILIDPRNYLHVPVQYWPLLFLRLWSLYWWTRYHDRDVIYEVLPTGHVYIHFYADEARDLRAWMWKQARTFRPHVDYLYNASGQVGISVFVLAMARALERIGCFERWIWVRIVLRRTPAIRDSS